MRSVFIKIAIESFMALGLLTLDVQGLQIKNLVESSASAASQKPMIFLAEVLLGDVNYTHNTISKQRLMQPEHGNTK
jgi:hypothetical protein